MKPWISLAVGILLFAAGIGLVAKAVASGQARFALLLFIPVVYGSSALLAFGSLLLIAGLMLVFLSSAAWGRGEAWRPEEPAGGLPSSSPKTGQGTGTPSRKGPSFGGFLLIGPVPIVFGNRSGMMPYAILMGILTIIAIVLFLFFI